MYGYKHAFNVEVSDYYILLMITHIFFISRTLYICSIREKVKKFEIGINIWLVVRLFDTNIHLHYRIIEGLIGIRSLM